MKKIIAIAASAMLAVATQAVPIGWTIGGVGDYIGKAYQVFVINENGVTDIAQITGLLDSGKDVSSYAFGAGTLTAATTQVKATNSGKSLAGGTYTTFVVVYDAATPVAGTSKYAVASGATSQTVTFTDTAASKVIASGSIASKLSDTGNWKSYGAPIPEPTSIALIALGLAAVGLKRKVA